jgi:uncharacterized protein (TIGR02996 family)
MSDESALLAAILAHPDEDTPRLMYADWLQENGQPERAEFIRLQCSADPDEVAGDRAFELEERNEPKWLTGLPQFPDARWEFWRGFPEYLDAPAELILNRFEAFARVPWIRSLSVHDLHNSTTRDFVSRPWNSRWVELELQEHPKAGFFVYGYDSTPAIVAVANAPQMLQLRKLQLSIFDLTAAGVHALATSPHLERLQQFRLFGYGDSRFDPLRERFGDRLVIG